tara:strand:+ start:664 stop:1008 length:345 start_codon:yes stop_codon:yes gene_type:complete
MSDKSEALIQQEIVVWFKNNYCLKHHEPQAVIFSVPNEREGYQIMRKLLLTGLMSGVSDLIIILEGRVLFIEVKTKTGTQSKTQKSFQKKVERLGFPYYLVRSLENFEEIIKEI